MPHRHRTPNDKTSNYRLKPGLFTGDYVRARYYSPEIGRFLSPDPIGYGDGLNMYAYVSNDPLNGWDPTGTLDRERGLVTAFIGSLTCAGEPQQFTSIANAQSAAVDQAFSYRTPNNFRCRIESSHVPGADGGGGGSGLDLSPAASAGGFTDGVSNNAVFGNGPTGNTPRVSNSIDALDSISITFLDGANKLSFEGMHDHGPRLARGIIGGAVPLLDFGTHAISFNEEVESGVRPEDALAGESLSFGGGVAFSLLGAAGGTAVCGKACGVAGGGIAAVGYALGLENEVREIGQAALRQSNQFQSTNSVFPWTRHWVPGFP